MKNDSLMHADDRIKDILVLNEGPTNAANSPLYANGVNLSIQNKRLWNNNIFNVLVKYFQRY